MKTQAILALIACLISAWSTRQWIQLSKKEKIGQPIREELSEGQQEKEGTPTMGGVAFIPVFIILSLIMNDLNFTTLMILLGTVGFGLVGFIDDYKKVKKANSDGLSPGRKIVLQCLVALTLSILFYVHNPSMGDQRIPFFNAVWSLGVFQVPLLTFIMVGTVNAVNLTDGLDGLSSGVTLPVLFTISFMASSMEGLEGADTISLSAWILAGCLLGYLFYNFYPASVFMGDTGSMAIGGTICALLLLMNSLPFLIVLGGVYFLEALSVIIQVAYFQSTGGKRIFLMTPIHHHFELKGYPEMKVTVAFSIVSVLFCLLTLAVF